MIPDWVLPEYIWPRASDRARAVEQLDVLLRDGGSAYEVNWNLPPMLIRRVDPAIVDAPQAHHRRR